LDRAGTGSNNQQTIGTVPHMFRTMQQAAHTYDVIMLTLEVAARHKIDFSL
jgi:hypothetical protein